MTPGTLMRVPFVKMHGAGNDFVVIDRRDASLLLLEPGALARFVQWVCDRRQGVGADGVLFLDRGENGLDFRMRYYNRDGGEADLCGNGGRCLAAFAARRGLGKDGRVVFESPAGRHEANVRGDRVDLVLGDVAPPILGQSFATGGKPVTAARVTVGVPHLVVVVDDVDAVDLARFAPGLRGHPSLGPEGANVDVVQPMSDHDARIRTFERGVEGETLACGTGAAASAIALVAQRRMTPPVTLHVRSGDALVVAFEATDQGYHSVTLSGPVHVSFEGTFDWQDSGPSPGPK